MKLANMGLVRPRPNNVISPRGCRNRDGAGVLAHAGLLGARFIIDLPFRRAAKRAVETLVQI